MKEAEGPWQRMVFGGMDLQLSTLHPEHQKVNQV